MSRIAKNLTELIGNTPLLELSSFMKKNEVESTVIAKLEYFNLVLLPDTGIATYQRRFIRKHRAIH